MKGASQPSHPTPTLNKGSGFSKREYAAILLRVPDSGLDWLDQMIERSKELQHPKSINIDSASPYTHIQFPGETFPTKI